jgi:FkbM family methyltransferase
VLRNPARHLKGRSGVIHVGANVGQEREVYAAFGLRVLWIEPIPEVYERLVANIAEFPAQRALLALVTDRDGGEYEFHVASNNGGSSSILDFKLHREIWPRVEFVRSLRLRSLTLPSLLRSEGIDVRDYDVLVLDTQGSELLVLQGAEPLLRQFGRVQVEAADFEAYVGCCRVSDVGEFMRRHGYEEESRRRFAEREGCGSYYDIVYRRRGPALGARSGHP